MRGWTRKAVRYAVSSLIVVGAVLAIGWPLLGETGRRSLLVAAGVAVAVQWLTFGVLAGLRVGTPGYLAGWVGGTLARFAVVGIAAYAVVGSERVDLVVTLLAMVGLFFVLLLLEPWALREPGTGGTNG